MALDRILHFGMKPRTIQEVMHEQDVKRGVRFNEPEDYEPDHIVLTSRDVANYET